MATVVIKLVAVSCMITLLLAPTVRTCFSLYRAPVYCSINGAAVRYPVAVNSMPIIEKKLMFIISFNMSRSNLSDGEHAV